MKHEGHAVHQGRFGVRLAATLVLTTTAVGAAQYELAGRALTARVLAQDLDGHRADAQVLQSLHRPATADPLSEVGALLGHMTARPGLTSVALLGPDGTVVLRGAHHGSGMPGDGGHAGAAPAAGHGAAVAPEGSTGTSGAADHPAPEAAGHSGTQPADHSAAAPAPGKHGAPEAADEARGMDMPTDPEAADQRGTMDMPADQPDAMDMPGDQPGAMDMPADQPAAMDMPADQPGAMDMPAEEPLSPAQQALGARVVDGGRAVADHLPAAAMVVHAVPVELGGERHVLLVARSDAPLLAQVASVRRVLLLALALGAALALPLFFLVGGRGLTARHRRAVDASTRDGLTGLGNHRYFHESLAGAVDAGTTPLCLALVDLDGFKQVNDTYGHRRGDEVLATVARVLLTAAPRSAYRVGGDEFALLVPGDLAAVTALAEQVRQQVAAQELGVTTSIGVAPLVPGSAVQPLWDAADAALYAAKRGGRNRVVVDGSAAAFSSA